ncbi:RNA-binding domain-containing protein [Bacillus haynesii]|uniref:RNA-binding domain-containing protein n=2 Tax=Bacillus haynesii TaxID=1925021 RepID=UPI002281975F|nr:RNA-binding domain-containing protein [Bacillus haynesii]MCY7817085.1 putative DNA binding domain-containing protein [Bacillus haynesii]MCY8225896.1 putative DNA binding domain-containing protein [Bacillus haynesii]MCY8242549.1 putative DNA binding domain-containing protein [Bacillus haynesii]MCY8568840.1 putative DNA binding domain-containing protein [Bacillus haynesii]
MFDCRKPDPGEDLKLLTLKEDHFNDLKSKEIKPSKLQESFVAFANSDGGELYIGIKDQKEEGERIVGFSNPEEANNIISVLLEDTKPSVENIEIEYIDFESRGLVLHISIPKSTQVHYTAQDDCFIRINAEKRKIKGNRIMQLGYSKGSVPYEKKIVDIVELEDIIESPHFLEYMERVKSIQKPSTFLRKQRLLTKSESGFKPNVSCVLLFDEEPQATLDTRCAIKVYRLRTDGYEYKRELLAFPPQTINGTIESQIYNVKSIVNNILSDATFIKDGKTERLKYPPDALHEILVNAVIHRDYSINDDIHVKIYDNRIEILSPGKLPGYITPNNIYKERYSRNPNLVRMLHNLPNPVNHDIGEGLDTARNELNKVGLVEPLIEETDNAVLITIKHERIATLEQIILDYLKQNPYVTNKKIREISGNGDINKVKTAFQRLRKEGKIRLVDPNARKFDYRYELISEINDLN